MEIVSFLIFSKDYGLVSVKHELVHMKEIVEKIEWAKVEVWKNGQRQNVVLSDVYSIDELMGFASFYVSE
ncbi:hypothetical protein HUB98_06185 [Paenibacillus barcinonensis]|uniref:Uncharacterized protein n=1 Tax=Paenibacillus barcinonensis TaxID=198119 RepID=A0A2V4VDE4_PAEBA|nr:hypothetical protein [Paenibacillus barcinonensis]PYE51602.1 hypothetical protein DFQ00_102397 [Paenibacillus barcinonensis]QKS55969.1 hypothetical protein HUB98_06185 [Paenibacillus barcinonensis]